MQSSVDPPMLAHAVTTGKCHGLWLDSESFKRLQWQADSNAESQAARPPSSWGKEDNVHPV
jgi:hypothetical protein